MATQLASLALEGKDPRVHEEEDQPYHTGRSQLSFNSPYSFISLCLIASDNVPFEAFLHFATLQRQKEDARFAAESGDPNVKPSFFDRLFKKNHNTRTIAATEIHADADEKGSQRRASVTISDEERIQANRALRTATWINIFYLITTE